MPFDTRHVPVPGSDKTLPPGARRVADPNPDELISVTVRVRSRRAAPEVPAAGGPFLSRAQFRETFGASEADLALLEQYAAEQGLSVEERSVSRRVLVLRGRLADLTRAFGVQLGEYQLEAPAGDDPAAAPGLPPSQPFRGRSGPITVPADLAPLIEGVFGLDDRPQARAHFRMLAPLSGDPPPGGQTYFLPASAPVRAFTPPELAKLYAFPAGFDGSGQTIAIIELGGGYRADDLQVYFQGLGLPVPQVSAVSVTGGANTPTGDPNGPDGEVMLDIEVAGAVAPGARIAVYFAPNTDAGFLNAVLMAVHDRERQPGVISISWGAPEKAWTRQALDNMNGAFREAAQLGVSVLCASGDDGSNDRVGDGQAHTDFPSSSPYATGCGGTRLTEKSGLIQSEVVWNNGPGRGAGGGGVSDAFDLPDYQRGAGVPPSANGGGRIGRGVPDVAGVADPQTGYRVRVNGVDTVIGGTSAVSPLWAGLVARLNQALGQPVGFLNTRLYPLEQGQGTVLRDITQGDNGAYRAGPGWDACTGLGSPDGEAILAALKGSKM